MELQQTETKTSEKEDGFRWWRLNSKEKYGKILNKIKKKYY